ELDLGGCMDKSQEELSAGEKKKVEVAMCLLKEADAYLFDEPLANVDVESKATIIRLILERARGKTLIVIMHGDAEFHARFDRVLDVQHLQNQAISHVEVQGAVEATAVAAGVSFTRSETR